ncbi:MAG: spondin domain-containing protein [Planctomycetota bacterium]
MRFLTLFTICAFALLQPLSQSAVAQNEQAVIVTIRNTAPLSGTFQTPVWVGFHGGEFDIYDRGVPASDLPIPGSVALERIAEDGNTAELSMDFDVVSPNGVQETVLSNVPGRPPLAPRDRVARLYRLNPDEHRYFSYSSMVIPSNDAFVANGNPLAHQIFDASGNFVAQSFNVNGDEVLDAGTEINDEVPANTAFFGQMAPNTGVDENGNVMLHPGFLPAAAGGILADPMFANADFLASNYRNMVVRFGRLNLNRSNRFNGMLTTDAEVDPPVVDGIPFGFGLTRTNTANESLSYLIFATGLSGRPTAAHLHVGLANTNGPVVVDLIENGRLFGFQGQFFIFGEIDADALVGPTAATAAPFDTLLAELATRGIYVNVHTAQNPAGEVRGQLSFTR